MLFALSTMNDAYFAAGAIFGLCWLFIRIWFWWALRVKDVEAARK